jgi:hypothetical protein
LLGLLLRFETASILHAAIRGFVIEAIRSKEMCNRVVAVMLPFLMTEAVEHDHGFVAASCWTLLEALNGEMVAGRIVAGLVENAEWEAFACQQLVTHRKWAASAYGGSSKGIGGGGT